MRSDLHQRGYTLIEALIAAAILAGIATILAPAIRASLKASARIAAFGADAEDLRIADGVLAELFAAAVDPGISAERPPFSGGPDKIELAVLFDMEAGPQIVSLQINDGKLLYRPPADGGDRSSVDDIVLFDGVTGFRYRGRTADRESLEWRGEWTAGPPPALVEVGRREGASGAPPPLTFAVASTAPIHCLFDQVSRKCRE